MHRPPMLLDCDGVPSLLQVAYRNPATPRVLLQWFDGSWDYIPLSALDSQPLHEVYQTSTQKPIPVDVADILVMLAIGPGPLLPHERQDLVDWLQLPTTFARVKEPSADPVK